MIRTYCFLKILLVFLMFVISKSATAFWWAQSSVTAYMNAAAFPVRTGNITSPASNGSSGTANGWPSFEGIKIYSVSLDSEMANRGFTLEVKVGNSDWMTPSASIGKCVWRDENCSWAAGQNVTYPLIPIYVRLLRNNTTTYAAIPANTLIATIVVAQVITSTGISGVTMPIYFRFDGSVTPVVPTCDIKNYDNNVTLPGVSRTDLVSHGIGRYTGAKKEFSINLECENSPKVSVKFDGSKMSGVAGEDVLANKLSGNDNVGIQLVYNNNALKIGSAVELLSAAGANELLKFNAYYYYKGGTVQGGQVKANSEFTFTYE